MKMHMKICFIGLGSIGTRHIKNLSYLLKERNLNYSIDALRSSDVALKDELHTLITNEYYRYNELPEDYDIIFITNPTYLHYETISQVINKTKHLFIEKPVFESCNYDIRQLVKKPGSVYYVACPLRYSSVIKYLKSELVNEKIYSVRSISSSYLPDWRRGVDYKNIYSASKELGGGVTLDLIHEWDYLTYLFGMPTQVYNIHGKFSDLEISSDDLSVYIAKYQDKVIELHLDYFGRNATRKLEIYSKEYTIIADLLQDTISYLGTGQEMMQLEREDMYLAEMNCFLDMILNREYNDNDLEHAYKVLGIATGEILTR